MSMRPVFLDRGRSRAASRRMSLAPQRWYARLGPLCWYRDEWIRLDLTLGHALLAHGRYERGRWTLALGGSVRRWSLHGQPVDMAPRWRLDGGLEDDRKVAANPAPGETGRPVASAAAQRLFMWSFVGACLAAAVSVGCSAPGAASEQLEAVPPVVAAVPAEVRASLVQLAGRAPADAAISWRPTARTAGGRPVMQAQGAGALCEARNCPVGLFVEQDGAYRPILLVMSREAPFLGADGSVDAPRVSALAAAPDGQWRLTRYRWAGGAYAPVSCRLVDRTSQASRPCGATSPVQAEVEDGPPAALCEPVGRLAAGAATPSPGAAFLPHAFVVRDDADGYVEAVKFAGRLDPAALRPLTRCLLAAGVTLRATPADGPAAQAWRWPLLDVPGMPARRTMAMSATFLPAGRLTVLAFGVFGEEPKAGTRARLASLPASATAVAQAR